MLLTIITDLGIEKNKNFNLDSKDLETVKTKIKESVIL